MDGFHVVDDVLSAGCVTFALSAARKMACHAVMQNPGWQNGAPHWTRPSSFVLG
jgi:hypothetical protein